MEDGLVYYNRQYALHVSMPQQASEHPVPVVVILPGGAYYKLSTKYEGSEVAKWLNKQGIGAAVLHYRMPDHHPEWPQQDIKRAIEELHEHAGQWGVDTKQIGLMGFSAGGHAVAVALCRKLPVAFGVLFYPVISMEKTTTHLETHNWLLGAEASIQEEQDYSAHKLVHPDMPPVLIIACQDDDLVPVENSKLFFSALQRAGVAAQMHIVDHGGHGWGFSNDTPNHETVYEWLNQFLKQWCNL